jgi:hypothetical protein
MESYSKEILDVAITPICVSNAAWRMMRNDNAYEVHQNQVGALTRCELDAFGAIGFPSLADQFLLTPDEKAIRKHWGRSLTALRELSVAPTLACFDP